jgi:hypothetical protein
VFGAGRGSQVKLPARIVVMLGVGVDVGLTDAATAELVAGVTLGEARGVAQPAATSTATPRATRLVVLTTNNLDSPRRRAIVENT